MSQKQQKPRVSESTKRIVNASTLTFYTQANSFAFKMRIVTWSLSTPALTFLRPANCSQTESEKCFIY